MDVEQQATPPFGGMGMIWRTLDWPTDEAGSNDSNANRGPESGGQTTLAKRITIDLHGLLNEK